MASVVNIIPPAINSLDGIFQSIKNRGLNMFNFVEIQYFGKYINGVRDNLLTREGDFTCYSGDISWVQLHFKRNYYIYPKYYTFRGIFSSGWSYQRSWDVFGFNEDNKDNEKTWDKLGQGKSCDDFCGTSSSICSGSKYATFALDDSNRDFEKGYKYLRWNVTLGSVSQYTTFAASAIELFGDLSFKSNTCKPIKMKHHTSLSLFLMIILFL